MTRFYALRRSLAPEEAESLAVVEAAAVEFRAAARVSAEVFAGHGGAQNWRVGICVRLACAGKTAGRLFVTAEEAEAWLTGAAVGVRCGRDGRKDRLEDRLREPPVAEGLDKIYVAGARSGFQLMRRAIAASGDAPTLFDGGS